LSRELFPCIAPCTKTWSNYTTTCADHRVSTSKCVRMLSRQGRQQTIHIFLVVIEPRRDPDEIPSTRNNGIGFAELLLQLSQAAALILISGSQPRSRAIRRRQRMYRYPTSFAYELMATSAMRGTTSAKSAWMSTSARSSRWVGW
jgi:hypothetical protein